MSEPAWVPLGGAYPYQPALELIDKIDLSTLTRFASIPQDYDALRLVWRGRMYGGTGVSVDFLKARLNGDASAAYDVQAVTSSGSALGENEFLAETSWRIGVMAGQDAVASIVSQGEALIAGYAEGNFKQFHSQYAAQYARTVGGQYSGFYWGLYANAAPITQIDLFPHAQTGFVAGSRAWLYGIRGIKPPPFIPTASAVPLLTTSLPISPYDGQEVILTDSLTAPTYTWHLKYVAAKASNKWVFVGGSPLSAEVPASEGAFSSTTYAATTTPGPSLTPPVTGLYKVEHGFLPNTPGAFMYVFMSYDVGGTAAGDVDSCQTFFEAGGAGGNSVSRARTRTLTGGQALVAKYKVSGSTVWLAHRWLQITPVAIGG